MIPNPDSYVRNRTNFAALPSRRTTFVISTQDSARSTLNVVPNYTNRPSGRSFPFGNR